MAVGGRPGKGRSPLAPLAMALGELARTPESQLSHLQTTAIPTGQSHEEGDRMTGLSSVAPPCTQETQPTAAVVAFPFLIAILSQFSPCHLRQGLTLPFPVLHVPHGTPAVSTSPRSLPHSDLEGTSPSLPLLASQTSIPSPALEPPMGGP